MLRVHPFAAVRPLPNHAPSVASVPYDVVDADEARALAAGNPRSFLHIVRAEIDLAPETDPYDPAVYAKAAENFTRLREEGTLIQEAEPRMYLYRQVRRHRPQVGLLCCCHIDDYLNNIIRKHEKTRQDKEDDRTRHMLAINANPGPVFLTYRDRPEIDALVAADMNDRPLFHFNSPDGVTHTVWMVHEPAKYCRAFAGVDAAYVADGHHRSAAAARAGAARRDANPGHRGDEEYNWFMAALFPASHLTILPYNRVIRDLGDRTPAQTLEALRSVGRLSPAAQPEPDRRGVFCLYLGGAWHRLEIDPATIDTRDPIESLDVQLLQKRLLEPLFGIVDIRTDKRIDFVGGSRGTAELQKRVDSGRAAMAISMFPTTIEQLLAVADAGMIMPPKSTWFEPKLRSGLLVHMLD